MSMNVELIQTGPTTTRAEVRGHAVSVDRPEAKGGQGVAVGEIGGRVRVVRFVEDEPVAVGDVVETSSYGGLFPRGVRVGVVDEVLPPDPNDLRRTFLARPAADLSTLLEVALIAPQ